MKKIVVVYYSPDFHKERPLKKDGMRFYFESWYNQVYAEGGEIYRASFEWFDLKKKVFTKAWTFRDGEWVRITKNIKATHIFDKLPCKRNYEMDEFKKALQQANIPIVNNASFRLLIDSKINQQILFEKFMPRGAVVENKAALLTRAKELKSRKVVIKEPFGVGGHSVSIVEKKKLARMRISYPIVMQEFIAAKGTIPGIYASKQPSDLRVVYFDHKPLFALSRTAAKGSLHTNFSRGASAQIIPLKNIPATVHKMEKEIRKTLTQFTPSYYAIDFIFGKNGKPLLMEINTTPGFTLPYTLGSPQLQKKISRAFAKLFT